MYGGHLHFLIDSLGMYIQRTTEDVWEADNIINLIGVVAATSRHDDVWPTVKGIFVANFRHGIGQCEHDRIGSHGTNHVFG